MRGQSLCVTVAALAIVVQATKGVPQDSQAIYESGSTFNCRDGSKNIAIEQVNDDYCDCADGSDEPGTGKTIYSSRVNDGICDCCDGSDEYDNAGLCHDTCEEEAVAAAAADAERRKTLEAGLAKKKEYQEASHAALKAKEIERKEAEDKLATLEADVSRQLSAKNSIEKLEQKERAEYEAKMEFASHQTLGLSELTEAQLRELVMKLARQQNNSVSVLDASNEIRSKAGLEKVDPITPVRQNRESARELEKEAKEREAGAAAAEGGAEAADDATVGDEIPEDHVLLSEMLGDGNYPFEHAGAEEARKAFDDAESAKNEAKRALDDLKKEVAEDYGPGNAFWHLKSKCFDLKAGQYTYKMCPYENAKQDHTSLGTWKGFKDNYSAMEFSGGQSCWNGPARSCKVILQCGTEDRITGEFDVAFKCVFAHDMFCADFTTGIDETSTCVYEMTFVTPVACNDDATPAERDEL